MTSLIGYLVLFIIIKYTRSLINFIKKVLSEFSGFCRDKLNSLFSFMYYYKIHEKFNQFLKKELS